MVVCLFMLVDKQTTSWVGVCVEMWSYSTVDEHFCCDLH